MLATLVYRAPLCTHKEYVNSLIAQKCMFLPSAEAGAVRPLTAGLQCCLRMRPFTGIIMSQEPKQLTLLCVNLGLDTLDELHEEGSRYLSPSEATSCVTWILPFSSFNNFPAQGRNGHFPFHAFSSNSLLIGASP